MKHIIHPTLAIIAKWPDDKFERFRPYLRKELTGENYSTLINMRTAFIALGPIPFKFLQVLIIYVTRQNLILNLRLYSFAILLVIKIKKK